MDSLPDAFAPWAAREQFVCWFAEPRPGAPGKLDKFPCRWDTGVVCDSQDPTNWASFEVAAARAAAFDRGHGSGVGFVFTEADPYFFLDADAVAQGGVWDPIVSELMARLPGAACELSMSGTGLHWFGRYTGARPTHGTRNAGLHLELYTKGRFVALTGNGAMGSVDTDLTAAIWALIAAYFPAVETGQAAGWTTEPVAEWSGPEDDEELLRRAHAAGTRNAAAAFGGLGKPTFANLWDADAEPLGRQWPHATKPYDESSADMALADHLAFWTGKNCERMERLIRRSALARDKWDAHRTYLADTILKACGHVQKVATGLPTRPAPGGGELGPVPVGAAHRDPGKEYMGPIEQLNHFAGCFFLADQAHIFVLSHNEIMAKSSFDVVFGGHLFILDPMGQKRTDSAFDAFTKSRVNIPTIVSGLCFRPELQPGAVVVTGGRPRVNSYVPYDCPTRAGDASPFLNFLAKLLPDERDRAILLAYLAALAQYPGRKFQWWPVIQGVQGNGKTLIIQAITYILGEHYTHLPNAAAMAKDGIKFNSWIERKLFVGIEEIRLGNKRDFLDEFKTIVTNLRIPLEGKGTNQTNTDNRANGILCTNHKDGVPVTTDERRYAVFYAAQQREEDLTRDGMGGEYFPDLYDWFAGRERYAGLGADYGSSIVAGYLKSYAIPVELNPAVTLMRAPKTSSSGEAVRQSWGRAEQEIMDAIEEGRPGFAGGYVSSRYLGELLDRIKAHIPQNRRRDLMCSLGYDWHPALDGGRLNDTVMPDMGKPKLYLRAGHLALNFTTSAAIAADYTKAQEQAPIQTAAARAFST